MKTKYSSKPRKFTAIAEQRIKELFKQARIEFKNEPGLSNRYVELARKISMKYKVRMPSELKRQFCSHCYVYLYPPENCRIRTHKGKVVYYCLKCRKYMRFPYIKEKKKK